ncbi:hypothetical protein EDC04DRAFT_386128 [Pisolithus marmoratus]|nr:hypothetical protein EDC04DRAFT_386128 [Pisolithus marmoratus]
MNGVWNEPLRWCCAASFWLQRVFSDSTCCSGLLSVVLGYFIASGIFLFSASRRRPLGLDSLYLKLELTLGNFDDFLPFVLDIMSLSGTEPGRSLREAKLKLCMWTMRIGSSFIDYRSFCVCFCFSQRTSSLDNAAADPVALSKPWNPRYHNFVFYTVHVIGHMYYHSHLFFFFPFHPHGRKSPISLDISALECIQTCHSVRHIRPSKILSGRK